MIRGIAAFEAIGADQAGRRGSSRAARALMTRVDLSWRLLWCIAVH